MVCSTNLAFGTYPALARAAYLLLAAHGSDEIRAALTCDRSPRVAGAAPCASPSRSAGRTWA